jgi:hypothetical protein
MSLRLLGHIKFIGILLLALWLFLTTSLVLALTWSARIAHAVVLMGTGLIFGWVFLCGTLMFLFREPIKTFVLNVHLGWQIKFVLFAALLAMLEEAITTSLTNMAPLFGVKMGEAYITASSNYFDVVLHHSVIVFIPWFIAWAWLLTRYYFSPFWVFLLTGLNGLLAETLTFGLQHLTEFGLWIFVYGLMTYLPAYTVPKERNAIPPKFKHAFLAFLMPFLFSIPWAFTMHLIFPDHPGLHFPPIKI